MAILRVPCGPAIPALLSPPSNGSSIASTSSFSESLVPFIESSRSRTNLAFRSKARTQMSLPSSHGNGAARFCLFSPESASLNSKGKGPSDDSFLTYNASEAAASSGVPARLSEQEEFNKEWAHKPRRTALVVEPSPFAYVSGYKNRYQNFIRYLRELGDEVEEDVAEGVVIDRSDRIGGIVDVNAVAIRELFGNANQNLGRFVKENAREIAIASIVFGLVCMPDSNALAFGPEGPLVEEFWDNVRRYGFYFFTVVTGGLYSLTKPLVDLVKQPSTQILVVIALVGTFYLLYLTVSTMLGLTDFNYQYAQ